MKHPSIFVTVLVVLGLVGCGSESFDTSIAPVYQQVASAVPLRAAPVITASSDDTIWLAWTEASSQSQSVVVARIGPRGETAVTRIPALATTTAIQGTQVVANGTTVVLAWQESAGFSSHLRSARWDGSNWVTEEARGSGFSSNMRLVVAGTGDMYRLWYEFSDGGGSRLMSARHVSSGGWSLPEVVRETGRFIISEPYTPVVAAAADGSLMTVWYEWDYSMTTERQPGVLWSSQFDPRSGKWAPAVAADSGYRYAPAVASTDNGQWIVAWVGDVPGGRPGLWSKRHAGGVWEAGSQRIDTSFDEDPIEISLDALGSKVRIAWTSKRAGTDSSCIVRAAGLNTDSGKWSAPVTLSELSHLFIDNVNVRNRSDGRAVATWGTVGNPANAGFALSDASDNWQGRLLLDPDGRPGNNPAPVALTDVGFAVTWYRFNGDSLPDVLIRRLP